MPNCSACNANLLTNQKRIKCSNTNCCLHFHMECVKISNESVVVRSKWICPICISSRPKGGDNSNTPVKVLEPPNREPNYDFHDSTVTCNVLDAIKAELSTTKSDLEESIKKYIREEFTALKSEMQDIRTSIDFINGRYDEISKRLDVLENKFVTGASSKKEMKDVNIALATLQEGVNQREQWARRSNIEIIGIPEKKGENLLDIISTLAEKANFSIDVDTDIDFISRVAPIKTDNKKPKPIVVRFLARYKKDNYLSSLRKLKHLKAKDVGFVDNNQAIYFNDHLTSSNKQLLQQAKTLAKNHNFKYIWVKHCCILARRDDVSPIIKITSKEDLMKIK